MFNDIRKNLKESMKNCPPGRESDRVDYFKLGDDVINVSHLNGEVIFDEAVEEEGGFECIYGKNMTMEKFDSALGDKGFNTFLKQWCEEEHCTRALISGVDPVIRRIQL